MSKLIRGDFSYPDTQEQGHNERNKSSNSHVLYLNVLKGAKTDESSDFQQCSC